MISEEEVLGVLLDLKVNKASMPTDIPARILKAYAKKISEIRGNKRIIKPQSSTSSNSPEFYATENAFTFRRLRKLSSKRKLDMDAAESTKKKQKEDT